MKIYVVGLGPGGLNQMTQRALDALDDCDVIAGYHVYIDLIREHSDKRFVSTSVMKKETDRCHIAIQEALKGQR